MNHKETIFKISRGIVRFLFSLPRRVRRFWRTLLVWYRISRIYHREGTKGLKRFRRVRGVSKGNLRRKAWRGPGSSQTRPPFR